MFVPFKKKLPPRGLAYSANTKIVPKTYGEHQNRGFVMRAVRRSLQNEIPKKKKLSIGITEEILKGKANKGVAVEQKQRFHKTCVEFRAHLFF